MCKKQLVQVAKTTNWNFLKQIEEKDILKSPVFHQDE